MESLLKWGIENSTTTGGSAQPPRDISKLDPGIIDLILGKPESVQMKEALAIATDESAEEETRVAALDEFEVLIENIDNANDMTNMKMWEPLFNLLQSQSEPIKLNTLWILGTAIQNNATAQEAFLKLSPLAKILAFLQPSENSNAQTRSKAVYCLSGALRHNREAVEALDSLGGWEILKDSLTDTDANVRRKVVFLLNSLLLSDGGEPGQSSPTRTADRARDSISRHDIPKTLLDVLIGNDSNTQRTLVVDEDFEEKAARMLMSYLESGGQIRPEDSNRMIKRLETRGDAHEWGLTEEEAKNFIVLCTEHTQK